MRHIGLWIPHKQLCPGFWDSSPTINERMTILFEQPAPEFFYEDGCWSLITLENTELTAFGASQSAQIEVKFFIGGVGHVALILVAPSSYPFMPVVQINGTTVLSASGSFSGNYAVGQHTLKFSISPSMSGTLPAGAFQLKGTIS